MVVMGLEHRWDRGGVEYQQSPQLTDVGDPAYIFFKRKFLDSIQQIATTMVSTCNLTKQAFLCTMKEQLKMKHKSNSLNKDSRHVEYISTII